MFLSSLLYHWRCNKVAMCFGLLFVLALYVAVTVGLSDDEAYYWSWSLRPSISYFDHPPLLAWTLWLTTHVFGKTTFAVRLPALLGFLLSTAFFLRWAQRSGIQWKVALSICISAPLFFVFSWMTLPDVLFLPLGLMAIDLLAHRRFALTGLVLGLALLAKWHTVLLVPGIVVAVAMMDLPWRKKLEAILVIAGLSALLQLPVLIWNIQHDWISVRYHLVERVAGPWISPMTVFGRGVGFLVGFLLFGGAAFTFLLVSFFQHRPLRARFDREDVVLWVLGLPFLAVFGLAAMKGETRIYWAGFAVFPLSVFFLRHLSIDFHQRVERVAVGSCFAFMAILGAALYLPVGAYGRPLVEAFRSYDLRMSPRGGLIGWRGWAHSTIVSSQGTGERTLFLASDFRLASQLLWSSTLDFDQVSPIHPDHQFLIWRAPNLANFSKIIFFGDDRRSLNPDVFDEFCRHPPSAKKNLFDVRLHSETVKVIESMECREPKITSASQLTDNSHETREHELDL